MNDLPRSLAVVANTDSRIARFYKPILQDLVRAGVKVYAIAPPGDSVREIEDAGATFMPWHLDRLSLNPIADFGRVLALKRIYTHLQPDVVHHFTVKPNLYGALAAWLAGVPVVFMGVTGLGQVFSLSGLRQKLLRAGVLLLYRVAGKLSDRLIFQTQHDLDVLLGNSLLRSKARVLPGGAGLDTRFYDPAKVSPALQARARADLNIRPDAPVVLMASRLLYEKGVGEYVEMAGMLNAKHPDVRFLLAGERDPGNADSVTLADTERWQREGIVSVIGFRTDIRVLLAIADVVVHPTYYPEGIPRVLIEAASMARPIVSTTIAGVEQIVSDGVNGIVVPPRDMQATALATEKLLDAPHLRTHYGNAGRRLAASRFDSRLVAERHMAEYRTAWAAFVDAPKRAREDAAAIDGGATAPALRVHPPAQTAPPAPSISVILPARDAEATLGHALDSILSQDYDGDLEVIVADGSDTPATAAVVRERSAVQLVKNPQKTIGFGINRAIRESSGDVLVRCDAHAFLPPGYLRRAVATLERTGAANVGGRQVAVGTTFFERAVAIAMTARLGAGDARYRVGGKEGPVDTVYLGTFRRTALEAVGGFDPTFFHNQDYEVNWRLRQRGQTVWFDPMLTVSYRPRDTLRKLAQQYFNYGRWKSVMLRRHPRSIRLRHMLPPMLLLGLAASLLVVVFHQPLAPWAALVPLSYVLTLLVWAVAVGVARRAIEALAVPVVAATMHLSWAIGFFIPARPIQGGGGGG